MHEIPWGLDLTWLLQAWRRMELLGASPRSRTGALRNVEFFAAADAYLIDISAH